VRKIEKTAFGPVPSRRLGQSLGINNIPPKICTYSCVYCQLGRTLNMRLERGAFYEPDKILRDAEDKVRQARRRGEAVDYLTFVPDGEPTLDLHLGQEIKRLRKLGVKIAVITNSSLIRKTDVRDELFEADWVSLKIDALSPDVWRKINRPHGSLSLDQILEGISEFARIFKGELATETMLVQGLNDLPREIEKISAFVAGIKPKKCYVAVPIRPPAEKWVKPPEEYSINRAYQAFKEKSIDTEYLIGYEGNAFAFTGNVEEDLLSIMSVHPMREDAVLEFLKKAGTDWTVMEKLIEERKLVETKYKDRIFYVRELVDYKTPQGEADPPRFRRVSLGK
jgi:wyosine [tRNA(Phe)-imidazoG37] synthetase (radical SAM superfamily)